jgi:hypothetical protein
MMRPYIENVLAQRTGCDERQKKVGGKRVTFPNDMDWNHEYHKIHRRPLWNLHAKVANSIKTLSAMKRELAATWIVLCDAENLHDIVGLCDMHFFRTILIDIFREADIYKVVTPPAGSPWDSEMASILRCLFKLHQNPWPKTCRLNQSSTEPLSMLYCIFCINIEFVSAMSKAEEDLSRWEKELKKSEEGRVTSPKEEDSEGTKTAERKMEPVVTTFYRPHPSIDVDVQEPPKKKMCI